MGIARDPKVPGSPYVDAKFQVVVAVQFRDVADQLQLLFVLVERTIAPVNAQPRTDVEPNCVRIGPSVSIYQRLPKRPGSGIVGSCNIEGRSRNCRCATRQKREPRQPNESVHTS